MENNVYVVPAEPQIDFNNITRIEYKGKLVLTTEQLAEFYGTKTVNIRQNFFNNAKHFIEGKHYFKLEGAELDAFKNSIKNFYAIDVKAKSNLYLWTKRGAARHSKSVGTNAAWDVYEILEDVYFNSSKPLNVTDFQRGKELARLAQSAQDPTTKKRLVAKAANLILGEEFLKIEPDTSSSQLLLQF